MEQSIHRTIQTRNSLIMDTDQLLQTLETNPELDRWFLPNIQNEEDFTVIIEVEKKLYIWSELGGLQLLSKKPYLSNFPN